MSHSANKTARQSAIQLSSGNVFEDLGLSNPGERLAKAKLAHEICVLLDEMKLNQSQAARRLGIDQPKVSALIRGRLSGFSTDRLMRFLNALNQDVLIVIRPARGQSKPGVRVVAE